MAKLQQRFLTATMTALQCTGCIVASSLQQICGVLRARVAALICFLASCHVFACNYCVHCHCCLMQVYTGLQAGSYRFSVMLTGQDAEYAAQSTFSIDTDGPVVTITSGPATISSGGLISFVFVSEAAAYFQCRWVNVSAGTTTGSFNNCTSPAWALLIHKAQQLCRTCLHAAKPHLNACISAFSVSAV